MEKLRLLSNNVWSSRKNHTWWIERGLDCSSAARAPQFAKVYQDLLPDVIGWQEGDSFFRELTPPAMKEIGLTNYEIITAGCTSILYNKDKLELRESQFFVYPDTMEGYEGTYNEDNSKSYGIGVFKVKENGKYIIFGTTHLWWMSGNPESKYYCPQADEAREYQTNCMLDALEALREKYNCPAIAVGDFNTTCDSLALKSAFARGYRHAHDIATEYADERGGCHPCYPWGYQMYDNPGPFEKSIDHIIIKGEPEGFVKRFDRYTPDYYMPLSDHFPVFIDVEI